MATQFWAVARQTALEASRQPVFLLLSAGTLLFIGLLPLLITHVLGDATRMIRESGLALFWMSGLLLGCYGAASTMARELRLGTLASILSKPMPRSLFYLAKAAGVALVLAAFSVGALAAVLVSVHAVRVLYVVDWASLVPLYLAILAALAVAGLRNYLFRSPFTSGAFRDLLLFSLLALAYVALTRTGPEGTPGIPWSILPAGLLIACAVLVLSALAVALATRLDLTGTLLVCSAVFLAGLMSDYQLGPHADTGGVLRAAYRVVPNWQNHWTVDALHHGSLPWSYVAEVAGYSLVQLTGLLLLGLAAFGNMEVKA